MADAFDYLNGYLDPMLAYRYQRDPNAPQQPLQYQTAPDTIPLSLDRTPVPDTGQGTWWSNARQAAGDIGTAATGLAERFNKGVANTLGFRQPGGDIYRAEIPVQPGLERAGDVLNFATGGLQSSLFPAAGAYREAARYALPAAREASRDALPMLQSMLADQSGELRLTPVMRKRLEITMPPSVEEAAAARASEVPAGARLEPAQPDDVGYPYGRLEPGSKVYKIVGPEGHTGILQARIQGDTAIIDDIFDISGGRNALGTGNVRNLLQQFRADNPGIKTISGERVSGARFGGETVERGAGTEVTMRMPEAASNLGLAAPAVAPLPELEAPSPMMGHNNPPRFRPRPAAPPEQPPALGFPQAKFPQYAEAYPELGEPVPMIDKKTQKPYLAKGYTPEMDAFAAERLRIGDEMRTQGYEPYFDVSQREHVDPANYPPNVDTRTIIPGPRAKTTPEQELAVVGSDEARARLQAGYARGAEMPNTAHWYAVKQVEDQFIKEYGEEEGRKQFRDKFATSMAATTGGADPESNFLMATYGNYLRNQPSTAYPAGAYEMPYPIGGRFATGNMEQHQKILDQGGFPSLGATNPKRHNFAQNFLGNPNVATMDEQMTSGMTPGVLMPPPGRYGIYEQVLAEEAAKAKVDPRRFQEVAWAGFKNMKTPSYESGVPMMQTINESIERTHRLTGLPKEEIVRRGLVRGEIPMYGLLGAIGLGAAANQYEPGL